VQSEEVVLIMALFGIVAGVLVIWMAMQSRRQFREMEHRERLAMIERGLMPSPESDPVGFERVLGSSGALSDSSSRARSAGITTVALGLGFAFLLTFTAGEPGVGIGIGGAFAILGLGFLINASMSSNRRSGYVPPSYTPPSRPPTPPS
jgi:hypothetical protein